MVQDFVHQQYQRIFLFRCCSGYSCWKKTSKHVRSQTWSPGCLETHPNSNKSPDPIPSMFLKSWCLRWISWIPKPWAFWGGDSLPIKGWPNGRNCSPWNLPRFIRISVREISIYPLVIPHSYEKSTMKCNVFPIAIYVRLPECTNVEHHISMGFHNVQGTLLSNSTFSVVIGATNKIIVFSMKSWLFNRDPYFMVYEIIPT